jgi:hypothetical protein
MITVLERPMIEWMPEARNPQISQIIQIGRTGTRKIPFDGQVHSFRSMFSLSA